jgi:murein DD-endopeptidase MepM/ murein hydrolase activator NlpD
MIRPLGRESVALVARLVRPYSDMARLGALIARDCWRERDPEWLARIGHAPALAVAATIFAGAVLWPHAETSEAETVADTATIVISMLEAAPAAMGPTLLQLPAMPSPNESKQADAVALAERRLRQLEQRLDSSESERKRLARDFLQLQSDVATRKREFAARERAMVDLVAGQSAAIGRIAEQTTASIEALSKLVARTGIDPERLIAVVRREGGIGGPYVQFAENHLVANDVVGGPLAGPMQRLEALRRALTALPLETPLVDFRIMSHYGIRRDPFTGQAALHAGLDLSAPMRTAVLATAPGTVTIAGWQNEYGNMVEIDHGYGIRTRYAHLSRVDVKLGEAIGTRVQVGLLGSTGRSTGPHLHYEVLFEGETLDPIRFIEAKRFVTRGGSARRAGRG